MNNTVTQLRQAFLDALENSDPSRKVVSKFKFEHNIIQFDQHRLNLSEFDKVYVFGAGKAAKQVAVGLNTLLGDKISSGCIISVVEKPESVGNITILPGNHPLPGINSVSSSNVLLDQLRKVTSKDLVLFITTGGASSMFCVPEDGLNWMDLQARTHELLRSGADIHEMNRIRSQWDKVKAGKTLSFSKPKGWINVLISDVPGDDPTVIGSGPAIATKSTPQSWIPEHYETILIDTPFEFAHAFGENLKVKLTDSMVIVDKTPYKMGVEHVAQTMVQNSIIDHLELETSDHVAMVYHGESVVHVSGDGLGGRNHHLGLLLLSQLDDLLPDFVEFTVLSAGTDGIDGNTGAAGIVCDREEFQKLVKTKGNPGSYLSKFDSGSFFEGSDCVIKTGPTGTNLMDVQVVVLRA
jgi:glycerate-2-kinase